MIDVKKMTRAQGEKLAARTADEEVLEVLKQHVNKHVAHKANHKLHKIRQAS